MNESRNIYLPASIIIAAILISGSIIYIAGKNDVRVVSDDGNKKNLASIFSVLPEDSVLGDEKAPVTVIYYGDYQCPFCGKFSGTIEPKIRDQYVKTGKAKLIFRNFQFLGPESLAAAEAAECARDQGKFWSYHDAVFNAEIADDKENNGNLSADFLLRISKEIGLDEKSFSDCFNSGKYKSLVLDETEAGREAGVSATPTVFVNSLSIRGLAPGDTRVMDAIESALKGQN